VARYAGRLIQINTAAASRLNVSQGNGPDAVQLQESKERDSMSAAGDDAYGRPPQAHGNLCVSVFDRGADAGLRREKFNDNRLELALHEWARFKANDSLECRTATARSRWTSPSNRRAHRSRHQRFLFNGEKTCIDCRKGIAHHVPDMRGIPGWQ
jgi:hypothetical protein